MFGPASMSGLSYFFFFAGAFLVAFFAVDFAAAFLVAFFIE